jgi:predicted acylesterase/phospholipase RssA
LPISTAPAVDAAPQHDPDVEQALRAIASRQDSPQALYDLASRLARRNRFTLACQVLRIAEGRCHPPDPLAFLITRKLGLCTYKDQDQPLADRLRTAEAMLYGLLGHAGLPTADRQDTLGILGGINKQRWRAFGNRAHLEASLAWYLKGRAVGMIHDAGYTALNAAFVMDALADTDRTPAGALSDAGQQRRTEAAAIRAEILQVLPEELPETASADARWWHYCTRGEALLGLRRYGEAKAALASAASVGANNWQREATARQLADLTSLYRPSDSPDVDRQAAFAVVGSLLRTDASGPAAAAHAEEAARLFVAGKVGLALSGGGFRASLFHIGVLARLAELDVLRHVEVISCVSGGSIVGAYYYLKLQRLLETHDDTLSRDDYIRLVQEMEAEFVAGVQRNIRNLMLFGFKSNLRVLTSRSSSMTHRLGDLYERELFSRIEDGRAGKPRLLKDLKIAPGGNTGFVPKTDNWNRRCKVPILILNATTLNTCHSWQFTATYMGEPPTRSINTDINANGVLRRMYHHEAPLAHRENMRVGHAVAASACVPGLFEPLALEDLYQGGYVTRLVDGGVYDNQGTASLLEQDCTVLLVSDASGQTAQELEPADSRVGVLTRTQNVLMARVREAQYELLSTLSANSLVRGVLYLHLKKDLHASPVDWYNCPNPSAPPPQLPLTGYGMRRDVQTRLAAIRTDLDAFSDAEADALMLSGYLMAGQQFAECIQNLPTSSAPAATWRFQQITNIACHPLEQPGLSELLRMLDIGGALGFKPMMVSARLRWASRAVLVAALGAVVYAAWSNWTSPVAVTRTHMLVAVLLLPAAAIVLAVGRRIARHARYRNKPQQILLSVVVCTGGWLLAKMYAAIADPVYLRSGPNYRGRQQS